MKKHMYRLSKKKRGEPFHMKKTYVSTVEKKKKGTVSHEKTYVSTVEKKKREPFHMRKYMYRLSEFICESPP